MVPQELDAQMNPYAQAEPWQALIKDELAPMQAYQPGLREAQVRELARTDSIYKLSSNESPLPPFPSSIAAMCDALSCLNEYPDGSAYELTEAISAHFNIAKEQIMIGNGSNELIDLIAAACLNCGDEVVYPWPSFIVYRSSAQLYGAKRSEISLKQDGRLDLEAMLAAINERTKLVYICTPNNPTGATVSAAELKDFMERVPPHVLVVADAAYEEFIDDTDSARPLDYFDGKRPYAVLRTFSKMYALAGIRCGYGFAPSALVQAVAKVREPFNVNTVAQVAAMACLDDVDELQRRKTLNAHGKAKLQSCLTSLGIRYVPTQANFIWVEVPDPKSTFDGLLERGIIVRAFAGANGLRVGIGDEEGVKATIAAFEELFG